MRTLITHAFYGCLGASLALLAVPTQRPYYHPKALKAPKARPKTIVKSVKETKISRRQQVIDRLRALPRMVYVWQLEKCVTAPRFLLANHPTSSVDQLVLQAKAANVMLAIKVHDGKQSFREGNEDLLGACDRYRVPAMTWGDNFANDIPGEAKLIDVSLKHQSVVGYIADTEDHVAGKTDRLRKLLKLIRRQRSDQLLGYTTFPFISIHKEIDYAGLTSWADFAQPQLYTHQMKRDGKQVVSAWARMKREWNHQRKNYGTAKQVKRLPIPLMPIGQTYDDISLSDRQQFVTLAEKEANFALYSWQDMDSASWKLICRPLTRSQPTILAAAH